MEVADRIKTLPRYLFAEIDKKIKETAAKGVDIIKLGIGDPDMPTPSFIVDSMKEEVAKPENHDYPPDEGLLVFRQAVADYYKDRFQVEIDSQREVIPLIGSKEGIAHISFCYTNPGDFNLVPDPGYPVYGISTLFAGGKVHNIPLLEENDYYPQFSKIPDNVAAKAKLLFLNYPNNPTGAVASMDFFREAVEFAKKYDVLICHDSAYSEIFYPEYTPPSILAVPGAKDVALEFGSLSKPFNMTGWRIGYAVGNQKAAEALYRFKTNVDSGIFKAVQHAGVVALTNPQSKLFLADLRKMYQGRRNVVIKALREMGCPVQEPKASFYVWAPVPKGYTSQEFVSKVLEETGVVVTPGNGFGEKGEGYFRIALTVDEKRMQEAMNRIKEKVSW